jgi:hypothetical protein
VLSRLVAKHGAGALDSKRLSHLEEALSLEQVDGEQPLPLSGRMGEARRCDNTGDGRDDGTGYE